MSDLVENSGQLSQEHAKWNSDARNETRAEQLDRNLNELLQELRVTQTGVQLLFAFLLTLAFTERFPQLADWQRGVYVATLMATAAAAGLLIAPVAYHRAVFRMRAKERTVAAGHALAQAGLAVLVVALCLAVLLVTSAVVSVTTSAILTALAALWLTVLWYALPFTHGRHGKDLDDLRP
jgi:hypothetical protein